MRTTQKFLVVPFLLLILALGVPVAAAQWQTEVATGTRFLVELQTRLDGKRVSPGYEFEARTVEALPLIDGNFIPAGARLTGQVTSVDGDHKMYLRFERIDAGRGPMPLVASVTGVPGERKVKDSTSDKGDVRSTGGHLMLERGARLELQMDRPLVIER